MVYFCYSRAVYVPAHRLLGGPDWRGGVFFLKKFFLYVILKLCTQFKFPTMPATGQKVCGGSGGVVVVVA